MSTRARFLGLLLRTVCRSAPRPAALSRPHPEFSRAQVGPRGPWPFPPRSSQPTILPKDRVRAQGHGESRRTRHFLGRQTSGVAARSLAGSPRCALTGPGTITPSSAYTVTPVTGEAHNLVAPLDVVSHLHGPRRHSSVGGVGVLCRPVAHAGYGTGPGLWRHPGSERSGCLVAVGAVSLPPPCLLGGGGPASACHPAPWHAGW